MKRINIILYSRALLALSVFFWHIPDLSKYVIPGRISVQIFFGISSFVIIDSFNNKKLTIVNVLNFYKKRLLRIYPVFFLSSLLMLAILLINNHYIEINSDNIFPQFLFFQFNHNYLLNGVFWTLGIEMNFYLIVPLIIILTRKYINSKSSICFVIYFAILIFPILITILNQDLSKLDLRNIFGNFSHFYVSFIAYELLKYRNSFLAYFKYLFLVFLFLLVILIYFYYSHPFLFWTLGKFIVDLMILILLLIHDNLSSTFINNKNILISFLEYIGKISFGIYAYHYVVFKLLPYNYFNFLIILLVTIFFSTISYLFIEPFFLSFSKVKNK